MQPPGKEPYNFLNNSTASMPLNKDTKRHLKKIGHEILANVGQQQMSTTLSLASLNDDNGAIKQGEEWTLPGVGTYRNKAVYAFTGDTLPTGLVASDYFVQDRYSDMTDQIPYNHKFEPSNVRIANGVLSLTVPGGQNPISPSEGDIEGTPISCGEIVTKEGNIRYASVRTRAIFSKEPGTCHGLFYYKHDAQEADIEYLTDPASGGNDGEGHTIPIWYSNRANATGKESTHLSKVPPGQPAMDPTTSFHEHRIDWTPEYTEYFFDGHSRAKFTKDVPQLPGHWVWDNWANGDPAWSGGPPARDNVLRIESIVMYYNTSDSSSQSTPPQEPSQTSPQSPPVPSQTSQAVEEGKSSVLERAAVGSLLCLC